MSYQVIRNEDGSATLSLNLDQRYISDILAKNLSAEMYRQYMENVDFEKIASALL